MADRLQWMHKHFVLLRYRTLQAAIAQEGYKFPESGDVPQDIPGSEDFILKLGELKKYKEACDFFAYVLHKRAAVWWAYECVRDLYSELAENPAVEVNIADIGKPKPVKVPDWVATEPPPLTPEELQRQKQEEEAIDALQGIVDDIKGLTPAPIQKLVDEAVGALNTAFAKQYGMTPMELMEKAVASMNEHDLNYIIDPDSPIFKEADKLKGEIEKVRQDSVALIQKAVPPRNPVIEQQKRDNALLAAYRWIVAPDEVNSQQAMDAGNATPDTPAGLLALAAFWSYGNLTPMGKQVIATPPGLAANGIVSLLLQAALHKGGTRKFDQRYETYYNIALEVAFGKRNWAESLEDATPEESQLASASASEISEEQKKPITPTYKRWKPAGESQDT